MNEINTTLACFNPCEHRHKGTGQVKLQRKSWPVTIIQDATAHSAPSLHWTVSGPLPSCSCSGTSTECLAEDNILLLTKRSVLQATIDQRKTSLFLRHRAMLPLSKQGREAANV